VAVGVAVLAGAAGPAVAAKPKLSVGDVTVAEPVGTATVDVKLSKKAKKKVKAAYALSPGSANGGTDYVDESGTVTIKKRKRSATLDVAVVADELDEADEGFVLELRNPKRAKIADGEAEVTITDDDPAPRISVATDSVGEGTGGNPARQLAVLLDAASGRQVAIDYATGSSTAVAGEDFVSGAGTVSIPPGQTSGTIPLSTIGDSTDEFDEQLTIGLSNPTAVQPAEPVYAVRITDDDSPPTVSLSTTAVAEGTEGTFPRTVGVQLSAASAKPIEVDYATANGTAIAPGDFTATSGDLVFASGDTAETFTLTTRGDYDDEDPDETLTIGFSNPVNVSLPGSPQTLTITDDDLACVPEDSPPGTMLQQVSGDVGSDTRQRNDAISPCGETDWFNFAVIEDDTNIGLVDLHARVALQSGVNGSPNNGDLDLCVRQAGVAATLTCSTGPPGSTEVIDICVADEFGDEDDESFEVEVDGFGNAINTYTLTTAGNVAFTTPDLNLGC
jgi:hypothetical protein